MNGTYQKILDLLAKLPSDRPGLDWAVIVLVIAGAAAVAFGVITPDQLPTLVDAGLYALGAIGLRAASLAAKGRAVAGANALATAVSDVRAGKVVPDALVASAVELVNAVSVEGGKV